MAWETIGRPGLCGRGGDRRRREYDRRFGPGGWRVRHVVGDAILEVAQAAKHCEESYLRLFDADPDLLDWLCAAAADVYATAASNVRSGLDYTIQERKTEHIHDIALRNVVQRLGKRFHGEALVRIDRRSQLGRRLHPGFVPFYRPEFIVQPALSGLWDADSIECFWESNKVLQVETEA